MWIIPRRAVVGNYGPLTVGKKKWIPSERYAKALIAKGIALPHDATVDPVEDAAQAGLAGTEGDGGEEAAPARPPADLALGQETPQEKSASTTAQEPGSSPDPESDHRASDETPPAGASRDGGQDGAPTRSSSSRQGQAQPGSRSKSRKGGKA